MTKILIEEATLKLAMEALNTTESDCGSRAWEREQEAITAIKQALAAQPAVQEPVGLRDALTKALTSTYVCGRVWEAWNVGTMTENDFQPAAECDELLDELVHAVTTIPPAASQPAVPDAITDSGEDPKYRAGWNDCRQTMMEMMKARTL
jgi:hypothetical protein